MGKWFGLTLKFKQLVILKHALEDRIKNRKVQIAIAESFKDCNNNLEQLQKDLREEKELYEELSTRIKELRKKFN